MKKTETLIRGLRQESRFAQWFGIGGFLLVLVAVIMSHIQGSPSPPRNGSAEFNSLMVLGFLGLAYGRLAYHLADVTEALSAENRRPLQADADQSEV